MEHAGMEHILFLASTWPAPTSLNITPVGAMMSSLSGHRVSPLFWEV